MIGITLETGNLALLGATRLSFPTLIEINDLQFRRRQCHQQEDYDRRGLLTAHVRPCINLCRRTKWGMAMRAMSYDFAVVPLMGVPLNVIAP